MPHVGNLLDDRNRDLIALRPEATTMEAAQAMADRRIGSIVVTDDDGRPLGIFTERDLMVRVIVAGRDARTTRLSDVMTAELFTAHPAEKAADVRRAMQERHIRHVPIVVDGRVIGMLSLRDVLRAVLADKTHEVQAIKAYIQGFEDEDSPSPSERERED